MAFKHAKPALALVAAAVSSCFITANAASLLAPAQSNMPVEPQEAVVGTATRTDPSPTSDPRMMERRPLLKSMMADTNCNDSAFGTAQGAALVSLIKSSTTNCVNGLFSLTGSNARNTFNEAKIITALEELGRLGARYDGSNKDSIHQVVLFLRAGYYVQYYHEKDVGAYGPAVKAAQQKALDAFFGNKAIYTVSPDNGKILGEAIIFIDSAEENARYMPLMKQMLNSFGDAQLKDNSVRNAYNSIFSVYFRGHQNADFQALVKADGSYATVLHDFYRRQFKLRGTGSEFMLANAARELARFLKYPERKAEVQPLLRGMITDNPIKGAGSSIWAAAVDGATYYDGSNCSYYGTCNYKEDLKAAILPITHKCGPTVTIRAQEMSAEQLANSCDVLSKEEKLFHYGTFGNTDPLASPPVANDNNTSLEVVVFDDYNNYNTYAGTLFGISTDNGGMYLEGNPSKPGNQARFIAHEASWKRPTFEVWNLQHEYIHYLDARYNLEGDFGKSNKYETTWWGEGVAEYLSYQNNYSAAIDEGRKNTYKLSTIFKNNYSMADYSNRAYRWGYLAVRFMYERQRADLESLLSNTRSGDYASYTTKLASMGARHDAEFAQWLTTVGTGGEFVGGKPFGPSGSNTAPQLNGLRDVSSNVGQAIPALSFIVADKETASGELKVTAVASDSSLIPASGLILGGSNGQRTLTINPAAGKSGEATVTVTVSDGKLSSQSSFKVKIVAVAGNTAPQLSGLANVSTKLGQAIPAMRFSVTDKETAAGELKVTAVASDSSLIPASGLILGGSNGQRTLSIAPAAGKTGETTVTVTVSDGKLSSQASFKVTIAAGAVNTAPQLSGLVDIAAKLGQAIPAMRFSVADKETAASQLKVTAVASDSSLIPASGLILGGSDGQRTLSIIPAAGKTGESTVTVTVSDGALSSQSSFKVKLSADGSTCPVERKDSLNDGCVRTNIGSNYSAWYWIYVPQGTTRLTLTTSGGEGNADMFVKSRNWPSPTDHDAQSSNPGNNEQVVIENPQGRTYYHIQLQAKQSFKGLSLSAKLN
ncbi:M9 family metallopeptidase [Chitinimonas viridis]|uniref:microbial collagenase n=1 Tax=Chitinimonas viridis TaxID=664880 RepID=A0ABT8B8J5_9NEIS|nr:M9 family metallopeptidase [Chitinimonas viridis]MDN3578370.1 M9 family metallopeptidase [Chitinimonas viridis]